MKEFSQLSRVEQHAFPGARISYPEPPMFVDAETVLMTTGNTDWIAGTYVPAAGPSRLGVIYFYGHGDSLRTATPVLQAFHSLGVAVVAFDYRGYGASSGRPSEQNLYADALLVYDWLTDQHPEFIPVVAGRSVGAAVATWLAASRRVAGALLFSPPTSLFDLVRDVFPPDEIIIEDALPFRLDTLRNVPAMDCPILIVHGQLDTVIPWEMGQRVEAAAHSRVERHDISAAGYDDLFVQGGAALWERVGRFLRGLGVGTAQRS